jgi:TorA maturation chaperone TorD
MPSPFDELHALSQFFFAANSPELRTAYEALAAVAPHPAPTVDDWSAVEFGFNRLFVGPRALVAPPYASVYLEGPHLMGAATETMRSLYGLLGLTSPWLNQIPDDHLALELDALWQLHTARCQLAAPELDQLLAYLHAHLQAWIPGFTTRIEAAEAVPAAILYAVERLKAWVLDPLALPA